jgi:RNA polymerase sigma-54 factor
MEGALSRAESLQDHLMWQLSLQPIPEKQFAIGELLIQNLDENGFHREDPESLVGANTRPLLPKVMNLVQGFEPVGTCTRDYKESLIVQARRDPQAPEHSQAVIAEHLDLLERGKYAEIARKLGVNEQDVKEILQFIRTLEPLPGRQYSTEAPTYVIPDLLITTKDGEFVLILNDEEIPVLGINAFFSELADGTGSNNEKSARSFAKSNVKDARWFIRSIRQRNQTLIKIARAIVEFQRDFFMRGPKYLVPLTLKDIADEVEVHETTVSRISTAKYVQTEWGIFELKYFFTNSISGAGSGGSRFSKEGVKQIIKEILEDGDSSRRLSDQKISDLLKKQGINIARRTVAKYRGELDIESSYRR